MLSLWKFEAYSRHMLQTAWLPILVHELQAKRRRDGNGNDGGASKNAANGTGKAAIASAESQLSLIPTTTVDLDTGMSFLGTNTTESYDGWILDSGAINHMTYDASDFS